MAPSSEHCGPGLSHDGRLSSPVRGGHRPSVDLLTGSPGYTVPIESVNCLINAMLLKLHEVECILCFFLWNKTTQGKVCKYVISRTYKLTCA